nr:MAG TPA: minor tail protein [Caudoviricetes sp.]
MADKEAKIKFKAESSELNSAIKEANGNLKQMRSELRENASEMKANGETQGSLEKRLNLLGDEMAAAKQKTDAVSKQLQIAKGILGENSTEVQNLSLKLNSCKTVENGIQADINRTNTALERQKNASAQAESAFGKLDSEIKEQEDKVSKLETAYKNAVLQYGKTSTEANDLKSDLEKANRELHENKSKMEEANSAAKELAKGFDDAGAGAEDMGTSVGDIAAGNLIADFTSNAIGSISGLEEETRQYRNEQAKLAAIAQSSGKDLDSLKNSYKDFYSITGDETLSSTAVANMTAMGMSTEKNNKLIHAATGIWAQYGDSIPLDGLMESVNETANVGQVTGNLADALNWAGISEDDFNKKLEKCKNTQERQQLIVDTLDGKYGNLADTYKNTNSATIEANNASNKMMDAQSKLAETVAPVQSALTGLAADGIGFLAEHMNIIAPVAAGLGVIIAGLWLALGGGASIISGISGAMGLLNAVMAVNPFVLVAIAVAGLVTAFILLWNKSEAFRNFFTGLWNSIKTNVMGAINTVKSVISTGWNGIKSVFSTVIGSIVNGVKNKFNQIKNTVSSICNAVKSVAGKAWNGVKSNIITPVTNVVSNVKNKFNSLKSGVISSFNHIKSKAISIFNGVKSAITNPVNAAKNKVSDIIGKIKGFFTKLKLKIPVPSLPKLPHFSLKTGSKTILGKKITYPTGIKVDWHALGGIFTKPTLLQGANGSLHGVGEAGAEAITPIGVLKGFIEESMLSVIKGQMPQKIDYDRLAHACSQQKIVLKYNTREVARSR